MLKTGMEDNKLQKNLQHNWMELWSQLIFHQ